MRNLLVFFSTFLILLAACGQTGRTDPVRPESRTVLATVVGRLPTGVLPTAAALSSSTPPPTPAPSLTPTITPSPTPSPTPTQTAVPLTVSGDPRAGRLTAPVPQGNAPCGVVDVLDFPLNPPNGDNVAGGQDFGWFRNRYGKYHAGEDWWWGARGASFGKPVYSIGHGLVTYAEPEGWNRDKGVVIIQHTIMDGRSATGTVVLSFYGHLDPPSVVLRAGNCVARGDLVGQIGRPRSSPHLHFEIRTQAPYAPLSGYWPEDPTVAGWLPPSQFIWQQRIASSPGVLWVRPSIAGSRVLGVVNGEILLTLEGSQLAGLDVASGEVHWRYADDITNGVLDARHPVVYLTRPGPNRTIQVEALNLPAAQREGVITLTPWWQVEFDSDYNTPLLLPLPGGGVVVWTQQQLVGIGPDGRRLWTQRAVGQPLTGDLNQSSAVTADQLFLSTSGDVALWQINDTDAHAWQAPVSSYPVVAGDQVWLYNREGLYRLDMERATAVLHYPLPTGTISFGDVLALPDGGLLLAHADRFDRRLIAFHADGTLRWERSYAGYLAGSVRLQLLNDMVTVIAEDMIGTTGMLSVYALNMDSAHLTQLFAGGTRSPSPVDTWSFARDERLILHIGGGHMLALDIGQALSAVMDAAATTTTR